MIFVDFVVHIYLMCKGSSIYPDTTRYDISYSHSFYKYMFNVEYYNNIRYVEKLKLHFHDHVIQKQFIEIKSNYFTRFDD